MVRQMAENRRCFEGVFYVFFSFGQYVHHHGPTSREYIMIYLYMRGTGADTEKNISIINVYRSRYEKYFPLSLAIIQYRFFVHCGPRVRRSSM